MVDMVGVYGKRNQRASSSGILAGFYRVDFDKGFWLVAIAMVLPHLQIEPLQIHCVLLGVKKRAADSLLPNTCSDHLQAEGDNGKKMVRLKSMITMFFKRSQIKFDLLFHVRAHFDCDVLIILTTMGY